MSRATALLGACVLAFASCASPPPPAPPPGPPAYEGPDAWDHLAALVEIGSRAPGTEGAARAMPHLGEGHEPRSDRFTNARLGRDPCTRAKHGAGQPSSPYLSRSFREQILSAPASA